ncbi:MAG: methyltransferase domain-containing protein [Bacteroidales bacterium]|nr:methyltransferase domain-containing protein [Bacteroidales bacterium]
MEKEIWDIVKATDFKNVSNTSTIRILDIGCGPGNAFYHFYANFGTENFLGIEQRCLSQIKGIPSAFKSYDNKDISNWKDDQDENPIDPYSYFQKLIEYKILNLNTELNENEFNSLFLKKIRWNTKVEKSNIFKNTSRKFDLILLSKVLHYKGIKNPHCVIKKCINLLTKNGLIFIKSPKINKDTNKRRKVDEETFNEWIKDLNKYKEIEDDCEFLYFLGTKYYTLPNKK